jgi:hypothetical protein
MGKVTCEACKKKCKKEAVRLQDKFYHVKCFACKECNKPLAMDGFYSKDDAHYCADDYRRLFTPKCRICGELAEGNVVTVLGDTYHQQCFHCSKCGKKFEPGDKVTFSSKDHWCKSCATEEDRAKSPTLPTGITGGGIKPGSPLTVVTPPKPPRANDSVDLTCGLTPNSDKSGYASSNGLSPEIAKIANLTCSAGNESYFSGAASPNTSAAKSSKSGSLPRFGTPDNRFYNMSYLERGAVADYKRGPTTNPTPKDPIPKHFHRPDNFSYTAVKRDFIQPTKRANTDKQEMNVQSRKSNGESAKLAPIERDDWPGPPEPAAAYPELFREKVYTKKSDESGGGDTTDSIGRARTPSEADKITKEINELSKMTDSGAAVMILRDLKKKRSESPTLDPRNASRTPSAAVEPPNKPRYETPYFASPSRDLDMLLRHRSRSTDNSMSRSVPPSRNGLVAPRPGYGLKCYTPDILNSYHYSDAYDSEPQPRRPQSSAAYLQMSSPGCKTPTEEYDPTTGLRHSSHLRSLTLPQGISSHKYFTDGLFSRTEDVAKVYPYEQLKQEAVKLPGVDLHALERHLSPEEFEEVFKMPSSDFYRLPEWKRNDEKQRVGLWRREVV